MMKYIMYLKTLLNQVFILDLMSNLTDLIFIIQHVSYVSLSEGTESFVFVRAR